MANYHANNNLYFFFKASWAQARLLVITSASDLWVHLIFLFCLSPFIVFAAHYLHLLYIQKCFNHTVLNFVHFCPFIYSGWKIHLQLMCIAQASTVTNVLAYEAQTSLHQNASLCMNYRVTKVVADHGSEFSG